MSEKAMRLQALALAVQVPHSMGLPRGGHVALAEKFVAFIETGYPQRLDQIGRVLGPECFMDPEERVISYQGANYYRACDTRVLRKEDGSQTHCVRRVGHGGLIHEDYDGNLYEEPGR